MKSITSKITALLALVAMFALMADTSDAGLFRRGSSGSSGSWGSSGSSSSGSWGSSGSSGRRWHRRHSSSGSSGSSSWGSSGSSGHHSSGSYGSHGSSGSSSSSGSSGSSGHVVYPSHHAGYATQTRSARVVRSQPAQRIAPADTRARLLVTVPDDASVYLVGQKMTLTGPQRTYRLPQLPAGKSYAYPVKVEVVRDGESLTVEHTEQVANGVSRSIVIVEQAGQLVVQKSDSSEQLVAEAR